MSISMYDFSIPVLTRGLTNLSAILDKAAAHAAAKKFDLVLFWALNRFTREGTLATLKYLEMLDNCGVRWRSLNEHWIDSAGPFRDVVISLLASLASRSGSGFRSELKPG